jgi:hypothetical protein
MDSDMRRMFYLLGSAGVFALLLGLASGCSKGPTKVDITGRIVKDGQPLKISDPSKGGMVKVTFASDNSKDMDSYISMSAKADEQGNFEIKGIPLGKYKVGVLQLADPRTDLLDGAFKTNTSTIVRDVESNGQSFEIDLGKEAAKQPSS